MGNVDRRIEQIISGSIRDGMILLTGFAATIQSFKILNSGPRRKTVGAIP